MHVCHERIDIRTDGKGTYEITDEVRGKIEKSGVRDGIVTVFVQHTSCSLIMLESADPSARRDLEEFFERLVPEDTDYFVHTAEGGDDSTSHIRMVLTRTSETVPVVDGKMPQESTRRFRIPGRSCSPACLLFLAIVFAIMMSTLCAQELAPPSLDLKSRTVEEAAPASTPTPLPNLPEISELDQAFEQSSLGKVGDERRMHLQWRQLANRAANDPDVIAAKSVVNRARTDLEKRQRIRAYYEIYYGRMQAMAGSAELKRALEAQKQAHIARTSQPRVRPETDAALPTPPPARRH